MGEEEESRRGMVGIRTQNQIRRLVGRRMHAVRARSSEMRRLKNISYGIVKGGEGMVPVDGF